jgi:hypothetical protein
MLWKFSLRSKLSSGLMFHAEISSLTHFCREHLTKYRVYSALGWTQPVLCCSLHVMSNVKTCTKVAGDLCVQDVWRKPRLLADRLMQRLIWSIHKCNLSKSNLHKLIYLIYNNNNNIITYINLLQVTALYFDYKITPLSPYQCHEFTIRCSIWDISLSEVGWTLWGFREAFWR